MDNQGILLDDLSKSDTTLANLPPDIIRILIRQAGVKGVERLRVISRTWNAMVSEYLASRSIHPPLALVRFDNGGPQWHRKDVRVTLNLSSLSDLPHFRGALKGYDNYTTAPTQYFSPTLQLLTLNTENDSIKIIVFYLLIVLGICFVKFRFAFFFILFVCAVILGWLLLKVGRKVTKNRRGLSRLFSRCASIETLMLLDLDRNTLDAVREVLADVPVNHLILEDKRGDGDLRKTIIKMVRIHKLKIISLVVEKFDEKHMRKFFVSVTQTINELDIYESTENSALIFGKHREVCNKIATDMSDGSFSVRVMSGESLRELGGKHQLRFKVTY